MKILGVKIDNFSKKEIFEKIEGFLMDGEFHQITTTNAEFILEAQTNKDFKDIINKSDLSVADSISVKYAFWRNFKKLKVRMAGVDLMDEILRLADKHNKSIFLVTNKGGLSSWQETRSVIVEKFNKLKVEGVNLKINENFRKNNLSNLNSTKDKNREWIVFCNFGAPFQEQLIYSLKNNKNICLGIGVGGSFDFLTKKVKRAPRWMRRIGFEWLFRFFNQPNRWRRIFRVTVIFPVRVFFNK